MSVVQGLINGQSGGRSWCLVGSPTCILFFGSYVGWNGLIIDFTGFVEFSSPLPSQTVVVQFTLVSTREWNSAECGVLLVKELVSGALRNFFSLIKVFVFLVEDVVVFEGNEATKTRHAFMFGKENCAGRNESIHIICGNMHISFPAVQEEPERHISTLFGFAEDHIQGLRRRNQEIPEIEICKL